MSHTNGRFAMITGCAGQDGSYLSDFLLTKGYRVYGMIRRNSSTIHDRLQNAKKNEGFTLMHGDITDVVSICNIFHKILKDMGDSDSVIEVYNLAAQSHVKVSFETPIYTCHVDAIGTLNLLEVIKQLGLQTRVRVYQASSSELYGSAPPPQTEKTNFEPRSPYAISKLYAYWIVRNYREAYGIFAVNGILFNHESERRGETFVSRKITRAVANYVAWKHGKRSEWVPLALGNLHSRRDWGYAPDYVEAMWMMLQQDEPRDLVIATGESHSVKDFANIAFAHSGITLRWEGNGCDEKAYDVIDGTLLVCVDPEHFRPTEVNHLQGDATLARELLGWKPSISFPEMIAKMVNMEDVNIP